MNYYDMFKSVQDAEQVMRNADMLADRMARFIINRLHFVSPSTLRNIKKQLQKFNSVTGEWK